MTDSNNTSGDVSEEILQIGLRIMEAIKNKDAATLDPLFADDFIYRTHFGAEAGKAEFLQSIASMPLEILSVRGEDLKANVYGEIAILTGVQHAKARPLEGEAEESVVAFTDVFRRREGRWLMVLAHGVELPSGPDEDSSTLAF
jgi:ketosteroid isomerase-like protein